MKKLSAFAATLLAASLMAGCGGASLNTSCADFLNKSGSDQRAIAQKYLSDVIGKSDPGTLETMAAVAGLNAYCGSHQDIKIADIHL